MEPRDGEVTFGPVTGSMDLLKGRSSTNPRKDDQVKCYEMETGEAMKDQCEKINERDPIIHVIMSMRCAFAAESACLSGTIAGEHQRAELVTTRENRINCL